MKTIIRSFVGITLFVIGSAALFAQSPQSANIAITAAVVGQCRINAGSLDFGSYDPIAVNAATDLQATGTFDVRCTKNTIASIGMSEGATPAAGSTAGAPLRQMVFGAERLRYDLYRTAPSTGVWGDTAGTRLAFSPPNSLFQTLTIFGTIPQNQTNAGVGATYADTVLALVNF